MRSRAGLLALFAALVAGLALGLSYAWLVDPVRLYNTTPVLMRSDYRHDWIRMAALGYVVDGDLERALARLEGLRGEDVRVALAGLIEAGAAHGWPAHTMRTLSGLAQRLQVHTPAMLVYLQTPPTSPQGSGLPLPSPTPSPPPTIFLPNPTLTPTPLVSPLPVPAPNRVVGQTLVCEGTPAQLRVLVRAAGEDQEEPKAGQEPTPLAGVVLWLTWPGGADRAVTGLRPNIDPGYADFSLLPEVPYALSIGEPNAPVLSGLFLQACPEESQLGSWEVVVQVRAP